jgi:3-isopropylmalate/(R)-2-methylmalate dehydratase small subunit
VPRDAHITLFQAVAKDPAATVTVNLEQRKLTLPDGSSVSFPVDEFARYCMLEGVDELGYILQQEPAIAAYEAQRPLSLNTLAAV